MSIIRAVFLTWIIVVAVLSLISFPEGYNGFVDSDQNGSQFKVYLLTIK